MDEKDSAMTDFDKSNWANGMTNGQFDDIIRQYKNNEDNKPDTLHDQLNALGAMGFKDVDCYYKYGIFTMFGGRK
jgi:tRNA (cmo5U34)-methyltransferase